MTVYFALALSSNRIKIGCCRRPVGTRLRDHERERDERIVLLATTPGGRRVESWWQRRHAASAERAPSARRQPSEGGRMTEWFRPTAELLADIVELIDNERLP